MAYTALTFVSGEVLTAVKMNLLAANDASFHDGTGIGDATIKASQIDFGSLSTEWRGLADGLAYKRVGKTVTVRYSNTTNKALAGYTQTILAAPSTGAAIRPSVQLRFPIYSRQNNNIYAQIDTDGSIILFNWGAEATFQNGTLAFAVTYLID